MKRSAWGICLFLLVAGLPSFAEARDDWEYWSLYEVETTLLEKLDLKVKPEIRFQDDFGNFWYATATTTLLWKPEKFLEIGPGYKYAYEERSNGKNIDENRIFLETTLKTSVDKWKFSNRHRFERRDVSGKEAFRWRTQVKISHPVALGAFDIAPFASEEVFWDAKKDEFNQNRVTLGISRKLSKVTTLDLFYLLRSDRTGTDWNERHVLGTELKLSF